MPTTFVPSDDASGSAGGYLPPRQAQEWYREEAVGRAVRRATFAEATAPSGEGGERENAINTVEGAAAKEGGSSGGGGALSREHLFVTTKIHPRDFAAERMSAMVETSNRNLQVGDRRPPCDCLVAFGTAVCTRRLLLFWGSALDPIENY